MSIKRINLSFNLSRSEDKRVYDILVNKKHKTDYIVKLVLEEGNLNENKIRQVFKEIISEHNMNFSKVESKEIEEVPAQIFDIFNQM